MVTREQFRRWTGLQPADGVLVTNYMEVAPGRLAIACWTVETR
jgi:hypothetical protein